MTGFVAVDLGATSGRVMLGEVDGTAEGTVALTELHRFANGPVPMPGGGLRWDVEALMREVRHGLSLAPQPVSIGIDSWAVDYGLIDGDGRLDGDVRCYRDPRTAGMAERLRTLVDDETLYRINGLQYLPFNTIYQLMSEPPQRLAGHTMLLLPDLVGYWLTGATGAELTNASTTGLLDATTRNWSADLLSRTGIPPALLPALRRPGALVGHTGSGTAVVAVGSHDTASAVMAVPAPDEKFAYISCGTWSLVGLRLPAPVLTPAARAANFTNESAVDGSIRFLRNTMGLWLLSESLRTWDAALPDLLAAAATEPALRSVIDPNDEIFLAPGDIPARIAARCRETGQPVPGTPAAVVRIVLDSLAVAHADAVHTAARLAGHPVERVHLVGGGARNALLCQLTADACGLPVHAGPVEATAIGNILVQARVAGREAMVTPAAAGYQPRAATGDWRSAAARIGIELR